MSEPDDFNEPSIESLIADAVLMEMELEAARKNQAEISDTRKALGTAMREDEEATAALIYKMKTELQERIQPLKQAHSEMANDEYDARTEVRKKQQLFDSLQRQIDQKRRAELAQAEWATLETRWDNMTMGAPWREWAKDHQIDGAKKITYEGRMILADTMGLGKTLTSLIAIDMIEAATKDASPENPVEFGSMK